MAVVWNQVLTVMPSSFTRRENARKLRVFSLLRAEASGRVHPGRRLATLFLPDTPVAEEVQQAHAPRTQAWSRSRSSALSRFPQSWRRVSFRRSGDSNRVLPPSSVM